MYPRQKGCGAASKRLHHFPNLFHFDACPKPGQATRVEYVRQSKALHKRQQRKMTQHLVGLNLTVCEHSSCQVYWYEGRKSDRI